MVRPLEIDMIFDHIAQVVPDIAEAVEWYKANVHGTRVLYQDATWAFLETGGTRLAFVLRDQHPGHLAFRVEDALLDRLASERGAVVRPHRDGSRSFYLDAPGGQSIEIISYPAGDPFRS
jgi:catechol 2,3-dioxygenase-like lactoylglutathione lyase family enzyme